MTIMNNNKKKKCDDLIKRTKSNCSGIEIKFCLAKIACCNQLEAVLGITNTRSKITFIYN